ncbi:exonuclease domain-containing protein [Sphingobium sp. JS3065]|uniref:exonuclease domain-containing protein n=1 Tax=Sphingobium sp. JS3065 TaxID=2970925 RepID=UPI002264D4FE|nr:exonuclease domain-containing protein [Sphingobium sp. JS3065]UZW54061.1 exonuclease domain-containing protein [Sphingobium sp. JS3065]
MRFVAIDVETANAKYSSICQLGMVRFEHGKEVAAESIYIDPCTHFSPINTRIHGISEKHVSGAKKFDEVHDLLHEWTHDSIVVSHSHFDRSAVRLACEDHSLPTPTWNWFDSAAIARRVWPQLASAGFKLKVVAGHLGITFRHHDAVHDARACGQIALRAMEETGSSLAEILKRQAAAYVKETLRRTGDGDGALTGENIVFTGELSVPRSLAANMAAEAGGNVDSGVTKKTTMLVVGERDLMPGWGEKSGKHLKAEALIEKGQDIRIVGENDFMSLAAIKD